MFIKEILLKYRIFGQKNEKNLFKFKFVLKLFLKDYTDFVKNSAVWREQFAICFWYFARE